MTAKEDKKTPARVGREPELILAQPWERPSLAGGVLCVISPPQGRGMRCQGIWRWRLQFSRLKNCRDISLGHILVFELRIFSGTLNGTLSAEVLITS